VCCGRAARQPLCLAFGTSTNTIAVPEKVLEIPLRQNKNLGNREKQLAANSTDTRGRSESEVWPEGGVSDTRNQWEICSQKNPDTTPSGKGVWVGGEIAPHLDGSEGDSSGRLSYPRFTLPVSPFEKDAYREEGRGNFRNISKCMNESCETQREKLD